MFYETADQETAKRIFAVTSRTPSDPATVRIVTGHLFAISAAIFITSTILMIFGQLHEQKTLQSISLICLGAAQLPIIFGSRKRVVERRLLKPRWDIYALQAVWAITLILALVLVF